MTFNSKNGLRITKSKAPFQNRKQLKSQEAGYCFRVVKAANEIETEENLKEKMLSGPDSRYKSSYCIKFADFQSVQHNVWKSSGSRAEAHLLITG